MKRYLIAVIFTITLIGLFDFTNIRLFEFDLSARISDNLFTNLRSEPDHDESFVILNSGTLTGAELKIKIDTLLKFRPQIVGINLCDVDEGAYLLEKAYANKPEVVLAVCRDDYDPLSRAIREGNLVTEFKTDRHYYFEFRIADTSNILTNLGDDRARERINYYGTFKTFHHFDLTDLDDLMPEFLENKIVLIGYCGDYVSLMDSYVSPSQEESMRGYKNARATPLNEYYEYAKDDQYLAPDAYDIQISANIIRMINDRNFITEVSDIFEAGFILGCALLLVSLITIIRTRWLLLNLVIYLVCYALLILGGTFLIVLAFDHNYYFEIPGFSITLTVIAIFTVFYNLSVQKKKEETQIGT